MIALGHARTDHPEFLLAQPGDGQQGEIIEAQQGRFVDGEWQMRRRWNGDQIDYGFNFGPEPVWLRIEMGVLE